MSIDRYQLAASYMQIFIQWHKSDEVMKLAYAPTKDELKRALIVSGIRPDTIKDLEMLALQVQDINDEINGN